MRRAIGIVIVAFGVALATPARPAGAQSFQGGVRGVVRDADGILPAAAVQLTETGNGLIRRTTTNDAGEYQFAGVLPGTYRLTVSLAGYRTAERSGIRVGTQTFLTIDLALELGALEESIAVEGSAAAAIGNAGVSTLVDRASLDTLPTPGRNVFVTATTAPTVIATGDSRFVRQQDQSNSSLISLGGGPRRDNAYVLDGVPIVDILNRATFIPGFEAVEEMRVQISDYDAEIGRTSGGVFNVTARSGSNAWHGSGLYQDRPGSAQARSFFAAKSDIPNADAYYHLFGGSVGGPIVHDRTFFWASTEGYRSSTTRSTVLVLPDAAERRGDFSQSGVTIYDPLTTRADPSRPGQFLRDPFPNNQIPSSRLNPVSLALLAYLPQPTSGTSRPAVASLVDAANQATGKITHQWSDRVTSTAMSAWYGSTEPDARFYGQPIFTNAADPGEGALVRRVHTLAFNTMWTPTDHAVIEARYGLNSFLDDNRPASFDPGRLGFSPAFLAAVPQLTFPSIGVAGYGGGGFLGDRSQQTASYYSHAINASLSTLVGRHTVKIGGESRANGVRFLNLGGMGSYNFDRAFTFGSDPNQPAGATGDAFAAFLLGTPSSGNISVSSPIDVYLTYWSGFAQDDVRVTSKLTLNLGLRYEFEQGLQERNDRLAVGWASEAPFPLQVGGVRPDGSPLSLTGGLRYAGIDGAPTHQGDPNHLQFSPRASAAYALDDRTVVRGGYGLFWAAQQGISADEYGSGTPGYNQSTSYVATGANPFVPCATCSLTNPFPAGVPAPPGASAGRFTGIGGTIEFVDPRSRLAHFHRYSADLRRDLPNHVAVGIGYVGMLGRDLSGGLSGGPLNVNQLDPKYLALGTTLQTAVPDPFAGTPLGVGVLAGATIAYGQLLRPYPQFDAVYMTRASLSRSRYDALIATAERRISRGWSVRADYTWSRTLDSQFSESNFFAGGSAILNNYNVDAEYGLSVVDAPHRLNLTGTMELPFGTGRRWLQRGGIVDAVAGGWTVSAVGSYQSGFPVTVDQSPVNSNLLGSNQRPNVVAGVDPVLTSDPANSYDPGCGCIRWLNPAAWSQAAAFTFGNASRTDGRVRTPVRTNWDVALQKAQPLAGATVSIRAELINVFNTTDFLGPDIAFGNPTFGQIRAAAGFPRMLQLSARLGW